MKRADASSARFSLIIGDDEAHSGKISVKPLREPGDQYAVAVEDVQKHFSALAHTTS